MEIYRLKEIPEDKLSIVGGKAKGLNQLCQFGFDVPDGFIVINPQSEEDYQKAADFYDAEKLGSVAVRSSATLEDGVEFSLAGQFSTFLNVFGKKDVINAIKACVDSLNNETAKNYAKTFLNGKESTMTVVAQQMVKPEFAGVLFSQDPRNQNNVLIEVVKGLGEGLVSGAKSAQQYSVSSKNTYKAPNKAILQRKEVLALAEGARKAEKAFGMPMDMEWAINPSGRIRWLQARPITISDQPTINEFDPDINTDGCVMTTCNIREMMPGAVTPLTLSTTMYCLDYGIRKVMRNIGCVKRIDDLPPFSCISPYYNHMFFNLTSTYMINHAVFMASKEALELSICGRSLDEMPDNCKLDFSKFRRAINTVHFMKYMMGCKPALKNIVKLANEVHFDFHKDAAGLYQEIINQFELWKETMFYHYWSSFYSGSQSNMLIVSIGGAFSDKDHLYSLMAGALTEIDGIESVDILHSMRKLARAMIKANPKIKKASVEEIEEAIQHLDGEAKVAYDEFMKKHGHRGIREPELRCKSWRNDPKAFADSIHSVLIAGGEENQKNAVHWQEYASEMLRGFKAPQRKIFMKFVKNARQGVYCREFTKARCIYVVDAFKTAYQVLSEKLVADKLLPDADAIYFLTQEEIGDLIHNKNMALVKKALARRRLLPEQQELRFPEVTLGKPEPTAAAQYDPNKKSFHGTPVSRGIAHGKVRIVRTIEDANQLQPGEIMVASFTDIGWSPYYSVIGGLITEIGSSLSHGVVVAREYALPTIVNVENIMALVKDGDMIRLDGNTGTITVEN